MLSGIHYKGRILLLLSFLLLPFLSLSNMTAKDSLVLLSSNEVYVLSYRVDAIVYDSECPCSFSKKKEPSPTCYLLSGKVLSIKYMADTSVYSKQELMAMIYVMSNGQEIQPGKEYIITAANSSSKEYIVLSDIKQIDKSQKYLFDHKEGYFTGLVKCYKLNLWQRILCAIRIKKKEDYITMGQITDKFVEFISQQ